MWVIEVQVSVQVSSALGRLSLLQVARRTTDRIGELRAVAAAAAALFRALKAGVTFYNHATGTVRMGPRSDPQAVVDATGAVRGVAGLSVADASIMPTPLSNVTTLTSMAIAEKVARDLRMQLYAARAAVPTAVTGAA